MFSFPASTSTFPWKNKGLRLQHGLDRWVEACVAIREELNWAALQNREVRTLAPEPGSVQGLDL